MRALEDLRVDRADVFAEDADEEELHAAEEEQADDERGEAELEVVPEDELERDVDERDEQAQAGEAKPSMVATRSGTLL